MMSQLSKLSLKLVGVDEQSITYSVFGESFVDLDVESVVKTDQSVAKLD